jgi:uncharacterized protein (DUF849 family)
MAKRKAQKVIISCAVTGAIHTPTMSDALPYRPEDIARQAIDAAEAGAAILHLHARDPETGQPSPDPDVYMRFLPVIKQATGAVENITTGIGETSVGEVWKTNRWFIATNMNVLLFVILFPSLSLFLPNLM